MNHQQRHYRGNAEVARELRGRETVAEDLVWTALRGRRLVVEVDGEIHDRQQERDAEREAVLAASGPQVLRVSNAAVQRDFHGVVATIRAALRAPLPESRGSESAASPHPVVNPVRRQHTLSRAGRGPG